MEGKRLLFTYNAKDRVLLPDPCQVLLNTDCLTITGEKKEIVYDRRKEKPAYMFGFFVVQHGVEYGTTVMTEEELLQLINGCNCGTGPIVDGRIHTEQFDIQFT